MDMDKDKLKSFLDLVKDKTNITALELLEKDFYLNIMLSKLNLEDTRFGATMLQVKKTVKVLQIMTYLNSAIMNIRLQVASLITFLHHNTLRYPYDKFNLVTFSDYTPNTGIVHAIPELIKLFEAINLAITQELSNNPEN